MEAIFKIVIKNKLTVFFLVAFGALVGVAAMVQLPVDAVPDITNVQVVLNTKTGALDPQQVETSVTYYVETEMAGLPHVEEVRSLSRFGLSQVVVIFKEGTDIYWARQLVLERLQNVRELLPNGMTPELGPISTGLGEVLIYSVQAKKGSKLAKKKEKTQLLYLRTVQDFIIRPYLKASIKNIAEIDAIGGYKKEIHIDFIPARLTQYGITIEEVINKLSTLGENFGGGYVQKDNKQIVVRSKGTIRKLKQIRELPIRLNVYGSPIRVKHIALVREDHVQRIGAATFNGKETVLGTVLMLLGANSRDVAISAENAIKNIQLPPDVVIVTAYSRSFLVESTINTVAKNLAEGAILVVVILLLILGNARAAFIVALAIPLSMLYAAAGMRFFGISANLMSLGAIDFGLLVDASIVIVENVMRNLESGKSRYEKFSEKLTLVVDSCKQVAKPVSIGLLIIMVVYVPLLSLEGIEGKMFKPMASTVLMALGASLLLALLLMPALVFVFLKPPREEKKEPIFFRFISRVYKPTLEFSLRYRYALLAPAGALLVLSGVLFHGMGSNFVPQLGEGDLLISFLRETSIGIDSSMKMQRKSEGVIRSFPEVNRVFARVGTAESATDPMGVYMGDTFTILEKDHSKWPKINGRVRTVDELRRAIKERLKKEIPNQEIVISQPIEFRFNEILEGSRADVSLRIYGPDLEKLIVLQNKARDIISAVPGAEEVELDAITALRKSPVLDIEIDHEKLARYGVHLSAVNSVLEIAMGGRRVGSFYEYDWRFPIVVRMAEEYRNQFEYIKNIPVGLGDGGTIPLRYLTNIRQKEKVMIIARNRNRRYAAVAVNLGDRDTASFVAEAQQKIKEKLNLPEGYQLHWGGQFKNLEKARKRLLVIVPITLALIFILLLRNFGSLKLATLVYLCIPFAMTGGVLALYVRGIPFSISAAVGFIALSGIAILNGMVLISFFSELRKGGLSANEAVREGAMTRLRPVIMTALVASLGFIPMALNTGLGAEVQRPLATVVIGGLLTSTILTLLLLPSLYAWIHRNESG